jgi:hypothetical protein
MCKEYCGHDTPVMLLGPQTGPAATSVNVTMEMIVGSVVKNDDDTVKVNRFVSFTTGNGHHIVYPWEALKETVLRWIEIEEAENDRFHG